MKCTFEFCADGIAVSDFGAEYFILTSLQDPRLIKVSSANVFLAARSLIAQDKVCSDKIQFSFKGELIQPDDIGRLPVWPQGFCDHDHKWMCNILHASVEKMKKVKDV